MTRSAPLILAAAMLPLLPAMAQTAPAPAGAAATLVEFQERIRSRMMARDANCDGKVSQAEWSAGGEAAGVRAKAFARTDANSDGQLDRAEIEAMGAKRFARLDADKNGSVTREERRARRQAAGAASE